MGENQHGMVGIKNAEKPADEKASYPLNIRVKEAEKEEWQKAAEKSEMKRSKWIKKTLNEAAKTLNEAAKIINEAAKSINDDKKA